MIIDPLPNEHRDIFHGPATETNLELHFKGSNAKKPLTSLKQHPKHIVSLVLQTRGQCYHRPSYRQNALHKCYKNTRKLTSF